MHQDTGERSSDPTRDWPRLACECPGVSSGGVGRQWPAAWSGALSGAVHGNFWRRLPLFSLPPPQFGLRSNNKEGTQPRPSTENWIKDLLRMGHHSHQNNTQFPPQPVSPIRKLPISLLSLSLSEGRQNEKHNHRKLTKLITWITALSNSMKLWAMPCRATQDGQVMVENSDKMWSTGEGNGNHFNILALRTPKNRTLNDELPRLVGAQ